MMQKVRDKMNQVGFKMINFLENKKGASNVEIIVWISVVLIIATVLFVFRDAISDFIQKAIDRVGKLKVK